MPKYTRKPHFTEEGTPHIYAEWNGKRVVLATVRVPEWHEDQLSGGREAYANAVLYAAAPELLEALREVEWAGLEDDPDGGYYCACPSCGGGHPDDPATPEGYVGHTEDCELAAAIAKAEGRSS